MSPIRRKRKRRNLYQSSSQNSDISPLIRLWILRFLVPLGGHRSFIEKAWFSDDSLAGAIGLEKWLDSDTEDFNARTIRAELRVLHQEAEEELADAVTPGYLRKNITRLAQLAGLSETDCRILEFATLVHSEEILDDAADTLGTISSHQLFQVLSILLDCPKKEVRASLSHHGVLACSGLLSIAREGVSNLRSKMGLLSNNFAESVLFLDTDPLDLLRDIIHPSQPPTLNLNDFTHIESSLKILTPYLRHALTTHQQGVNIFLYGPPGTGKTELCRLMANEMGKELFEVASEDTDGEPINGKKRLMAFRAAQRFFANQEAVLLFDEVEDVFSSGYDSDESSNRSQSRKAWINRLLEGNPVPSLWVSNSVSCLDRAFIRRFDMVIEMPVPSRQIREKIIRKACKDMLPMKTIQRIADTAGLAPAVITRAITVVNHIRKDIGEKNTAEAVEHLINNTLTALGTEKLKMSNDPNRLPETYDPAFINADSDLVGIAEGLSKNKSGRLCLYGPPGTGKTAFGRWLAERLDIPLSVKRASDIISKWVGDTEKNIATAFQEAEQDGALLLIDEMDSFLQDRRRTQHSWEVTATNEMLTRMESFSGVFIASTNLMDGLDQAALRRFDLKVKIDFLKSDQAWQLFRRHCTALSLAEPAINVRKRFEHLAFLTPGDFAAVSRQNRFRPLVTPSAFVSALEQECQMKESGQQRTIGFF